MIKAKLLLLGVLLSAGIKSQTPMDSLLKIVRTSDIDSITTDAAMEIAMAFGYMRPDSILYFSEELKRAGQVKNYPPLEALSYISIGYALFRVDSRANALDNTLKGLKIAENNANSRVLSMVYNVLGILYPAHDTRGMYYRIKAVEAASKGVDYKEKAIILYNIGAAYQERGLLDSALLFQQQAYELLIRKDRAWDQSYIQSSQIWVLTALGGIHLKLGKKELASTYYRMALRNASTSDYDPFVQTYAYNGMADLFEETGQSDSAFSYNMLVMKIALNNNSSWRLRPAFYLYEYYKGRDNSDSALKYLEIYTKAGKNVDSTEKLSKVQSLSFQEDLRQKELLAENEKLSKERKHNLQYAAIAIGIITFIMLFLLLSRSILVKTKFIEFCAILGLLAVFEFINLFIHPYLSHATDDSPVIMLLVLMGIAAMLIPFHHRLGKWMTQKMVEKNRRIRLEAAKKTIASLEGAAIKSS